MTRTIGYVSEADPFHDRKAWSGTIYKIRESIENAGYKVVWVPVRPSKAKLLLLKACVKLLGGRKAITNQNKYYYKLCAGGLDRRKAAQCDCLFFPGWAQLNVFLDLPQPAVYYTDATFRIMEDYYWHGQPRWIRQQANAYEGMAIRKSFINIRASQWAADSVVRDYQGDPGRNYVLEFGANIDEKDIRPATPYRGGRLNILFSGVDWKRKGGDTAVQAVRLLNAEGIDARLCIAGIPQLPPEYAGLPFIENLGFLNKNVPEQYRKYTETLSRSHLLLLPTQAECAGIVFCEAAACGLPVFTYDTGGVGNYVENGVNGYRLTTCEGGVKWKKAKGLPKPSCAA